jgi:ribosome-binding factor A
MKTTRHTPFKRKDRVGDQIHQTLSQTILLKVSDPRVQRVTVTSVEMTPDLRNCKIYFTLLDPKEQFVHESLGALRKAEGFFKKIIGDALSLRYVPSLRFYYDTTFERGVRVLSLINEVMDDNENEPEDD